MKAIAIYARVSSEQQAQEATVGSQVEALRERAVADGHIVLPHDLYVDEGFSGATLVRPALERLRDRIAEGAIEILYVHSPDRLARKYAYQVLLLDEFRRQGVTSIFLQGPKGETAEDELLVQVQGMIAEYERAKILERSRRGKLHRARQGSVNPLSGAPYGFLYVKKADGAPASYRILLHEAKIVRRMFDAFVREQKSIGEIVRALNVDGVPTRRGAPRWDRATVWAILRNPAQMGKAAFGKTEATERRRLLRPIRGKSLVPRHAKSTHRDRPAEQWIHIDVPAIVSREMFEAAQTQLERNKRLSQRNARGERYLLQGLTVCSRCGYAFYGKPVSKTSMKGTQHYAYYRCVGSDAYRFAGRRICDNPQVRVDQLDGHVWQSVRSLLQSPERVLAEWSRRQRGNGVSTDLRQQRDDASRIAVSHERSLKRLVDAYEAGAIDLADLRTRSDALRARIERARRDVADADRKIRDTIQLRAVATHLEDFATRVQCKLDTLPWTQQRQIIRALVAKVEIDETGATIVYRLPPTEPPAGETPLSGTGTEARNDGVNAAGCQLRGRGDHPSLRRAGIAALQRAVLHHTCIQPLADQAHDDSIAYPLAQHFLQTTVIDRVEKLPDVDLDRPPTTHLHRRPPQRIQGLTRRAVRPEAVRAVQKLLLIDGFQDHRHCALQHLVLEGRDSERPLLALALRDVDAPHGGRTVCTGLRALE
jgi:site-specific DNA recombinase